MHFENIDAWLSIYKTLPPSDLESFGQYIRQDKELHVEFNKLLNNLSAPASSQVVDPVFHQLFNFYRSNVTELQYFSIELLPNIIDIYLVSYYTAPQNLPACIGAFLLGIYNLTATGNIPFASKDALSLHKPSIYHEPPPISLTINKFCNNNSFNNYNINSNTINTPNVVFRKFESINAYNRSEILSYVLALYNWNICLMSPDSQKALCFLCSRLSKMGFDGFMGQSSHTHKRTNNSSNKKFNNNYNNNINDNYNNLNNKNTKKDSNKDDDEQNTKKETQAKSSSDYHSATNCANSPCNHLAYSPTTQASIHPSNHASIHQSIQPSIHPSNQPSIHQSTQPSNQSSNRPSVQSPTKSSIQSFIQQSTKTSFKLPNHQPTHQTISATTQPSIPLSTHSSNQPSILLSKLQSFKKSISQSIPPSISSSTPPYFQAHSKPFSSQSTDVLYYPSRMSLSSDFKICSIDESSIDQFKIPFKAPLFLELLKGIYFLIFNGLSHISLGSLEDCHLRASYEMNAQVLLVTNAILNSVKQMATISSYTPQSDNRHYHHLIPLSPSLSFPSIISKDAITSSSFKTKKLPEDIDVQDNKNAQLMLQFEQMNSSLSASDNLDVSATMAPVHEATPSTESDKNPFSRIPIISKIKNKDKSFKNMQQRSKESCKEAKELVKDGAGGDLSSMFSGMGPKRTSLSTKSNSDHSMLHFKFNHQNSYVDPKSDAFIEASQSNFTDEHEDPKSSKSGFIKSLHITFEKKFSSNKPSKDANNSNNSSSNTNNKNANTSNNNNKDDATNGYGLSDWSMEARRKFDWSMDEEDDEEDEEGDDNDHQETSKI